MKEPDDDLEDFTPLAMAITISGALIIGLMVAGLIWFIITRP